jgi:hypothetical protein
VEIYSPESDTRTPHLISKNTITYHSNFFEEPHLRESGQVEGRGLGRADPDPLEIEELELGVAAFGVGGSAGVAADNSPHAAGLATSTPVVRGALSPVDLDSASSDFYQHHQYQQQRHQHSQLHHHLPPPPLPSHRNRSRRSYDAGSISPGGRAVVVGARGRPSFGQVDYSEIEGSWAFDASGRPYFRGKGKIEEIREEEGVRMQEDPVSSPRKRSLESAGLDSQNRLATFHSPPQDQVQLTSPLPPATTPPPRPRRVEEVVLSPGGTNFSIPKTVMTPGLSEIGVGRGNGNMSGHGRHRVGLGVQLDLPMDLDVPLATPAPPPAALPAPSVHATPGGEVPQVSEELDLETQSLLQILKYVKRGVKDILVLRDVCHFYYLPLSLLC